MADACVVPCSSTLKRRESQGELRTLGGVIFSLEVAYQEKERRHSPDACFLCERPLRAFGDDCRQEQIDLDDARDREARYRQRRNHRRVATGEATPQSADLPSIRHTLATEAIVAG
ncbi:unnamed protein product [Spirodela intermedia]|uniref:Uncharacterized protein n=1 Tax=Spirodela intermedia TaxID=51605 RepID=A0A7I8JJI8_SPIIN|nr:unnamed protein product [Spirodela intermedia]CAA6669743.1 unnamed protein product [Spirodela intermedia]